MDVGDPTSCHSAMNGSNNLCHGFRFFRHTLIANWNALVSRNNVRCPGFLCYLSFCASRFKLVVAGRRKLRVSISCYFRSQTSLLALLVMAPCPVVKPKRNLRNMVPESAGSPRRKLKILACWIPPRNVHGGSGRRRAGDTEVQKFWADASRKRRLHSNASRTLLVRVIRFAKSYARSK